VLQTHAVSSTAARVPRSTGMTFSMFCHPEPAKDLSGETSTAALLRKYRFRGAGPGSLVFQRGRLFPVAPPGPSFLRDDFARAGLPKPAKDLSGDSSTAATLGKYGHRGSVRPWVPGFQRVVLFQAAPLRSLISSG